MIKDFATYAAETPITVSKMTLTIIDKRNGKFSDKVFYRPNANFPTEVISRELAPYGYEVLGYKENSSVEGTINWEEFYEYLEAMKSAKAEASE